MRWLMSRRNNFLRPTFSMPTTSVTPLERPRVWPDMTFLAFNVTFLPLFYFAQSFVFLCQIFYMIIAKVITLDWPIQCDLIWPLSLYKFDLSSFILLCTVICFFMSNFLHAFHQCYTPGPTNTQWPYMTFLYLKLTSPPLHFLFYFAVNFFLV